MCGILGSVNAMFDDQVLDLIKHRGPDDAGNEEVTVNGHSVHFGQRRLSILDLSPAGHQPMFTDCGNYMIILNGEIYNHLELRKKLPESIKFKGHSDTETILYYLKIFGTAGIADFNGIYAFAFLDTNRRRIILARDPFGVKPVYYSSAEENGLVFSSEIRPVKTVNNNINLDKEALASLLRLRYNPAPDTLYSSIKKVRPGHYLNVDLSGKILSFQEISFTEEVPATVHYHPDEVTGIYGRKLEDAVKRQLLSDVEVGILLSGGIDSALVAALAKKHYNGKLKAFTVGFEGNYYENEIEDAAETAELLGLEHKYRRISFIDFLDIIKKCTQIVEEPLATTSIIPMYFLSELASDEVKVVLTGQGADEPLGGYTRYKSELLRNRIPGFLRSFTVPAGILKRMKNENIAKGFDSIVINNEIDRFLIIWEVFKSSEIEELISIPDSLSYRKIDYYYNLLNCKAKDNSVERIMALDARLNLADDLLNYTDKITMNFALECRVPMLDLELVKFIESLPVKLKLDLMNGKKIHKLFARKILPEKIINRTKKGFLSPTNNWFRDEAEIIKDLLLAPGTGFSKVFRQSAVSEIIKQHQNGYNQEKKIFLLLSVYFWLESLAEVTPVTPLMRSVITI